MIKEFFEAIGILIVWAIFIIGLFWLLRVIVQFVL